ncbi:MAG TPA: epimerase [bacterium]|nr:epimerase [bacterium]
MTPTLESPLRVIIFGSNGMVGAAVLDTCLNDPGVEAVLAVGRKPSGRSHPKLKDLLVPDLGKLGEAQDQLRGYNACFYTLGVTSAGRKEPEYRAVIVDLTVSIGKALIAASPGLAICFVSGASSDETEKGKVMWARVKGEAENAVLGLGFGRAVIIRLGGLVPLKRFQSSTRLYRILYVALGPLLPLMHQLWPRIVTTPKILGTAMIRAARGSAPKVRLEPGDIDALGR